MSTTQENRTARLTILVDPDKKAVFEQLCAAEDVTPSQVVRRLIRSYIEEHLGRPWQPGEKSIFGQVEASRKKAESPSHAKHSR